MTVAIALVLAVVALITTVVVALNLRDSQREHHRAVLRAVIQCSNNTRRIDDRVTYYERRPDGLKALRAAYDKAISKRERQLMNADAAPEGTAQSEHLIG